MRDQIELVRPGYGVAWNLQLSSRGHKGAFTRVQKVIMVYGQLGGHKEVSTEMLKETFGKDAALFYPNGKGELLE